MIGEVLFTLVRVDVVVNVAGIITAALSAILSVVAYRRGTRALDLARALRRSTR